MSSLRANTSFVRLFTGRLVSNVGDSLYLVAAMWLVYDLTGSAFYTGVAGFLIQTPRAFQFLVGPLVDRWELRPVLVYTQLVQCLCILIVPIAAVTDRLTVWVVLAVMPMLAFINQFVYPAQNAALPRIVEDDNLVTANSLFSMAYQSSNAVFNAAGGIVVAIFGAVVLFVVNSVTFAIAALVFFGVRIPTVESNRSDAESRDGQQGYLHDLFEGIRYVRGSVVLVLVLGVMVTNVAFGATLAVLPAFAATLGGPETYGALMAAYAGGLFVGTVSSKFVEEFPYGLVCTGGFFWAAIALTAAVVLPGVTATIVFFFLTFVPVGTFSVLFWSMVQTAVDDGYLGRITSITSSLGAAMLPAGSLAGGAVADFVGVQIVIAGLAVALGGLSLYFLTNSRLRRLPPVADATESTLQLRSTADDNRP